VALSNKSSKSKPSSSKSKSNHNLATPETSSLAHASSSVSPADDAAGPVVVPALPPTSIKTLAQKVIAQLDAIEAMLDLDIVISPNDKHQIGAMNRVSDTAIGLASDIVSAAPERFPDFADLPAAASYVQVIGQVASRASELATHVQKSVQNQRAPAATKTLALYAVVKTLGRIEDNETMREKVTELKAEVAPKRRNPKPKVTKEQKLARKAADATAKRVDKALKVLAEAGVSMPVAASTATSAGAPALVSSSLVTDTSASAKVPATVNVTPVASATSNGAAPAPANGVTPANGTAAVSN
jgi:hypothetical protein